MSHLHTVGCIKVSACRSRSLGGGWLIPLLRLTPCALFLDLQAALEEQLDIEEINTMAAMEEADMQVCGSRQRVCACAHMGT